MSAFARLSQQNIDLGQGKLHDLLPLESRLQWRYGGTRRNPLHLRSPEDSMKGTGTKIILRTGPNHQDPARAITPTDEAPP